MSRRRAEPANVDGGWVGVDSVRRRTAPPADGASAARTLSAMEQARVPAVLSIAGSDSGGGAGIQADLKAFARCGVHGMTAITAITAQSTVGVEAIHAVPPELIIAQVRAVADDIGVDAVKIGMLGTADTVCAVRDALEYVGGAPIVIDPVMVAESGAVLLDDAAREAIVDELLPLAAVITPNLPEARVLAGDDHGADAERLARALHALGPAAVVVTGGHRDEATDVFFDGEELHAIPGERHADGAAHGSGCTHSSVLAAHLALGYTPLEAARAARAIAGAAVRDGLRGIGAGAGPVDVFDLTAGAQRGAFGAPGRSPAARRVT
jgi:hydroxymethylpyrimidine/phosphomethylpyrimidine kinase